MGQRASRSSKLGIDENFGIRVRRGDEKDIFIEASQQNLLALKYVHDQQPILGLVWCGILSVLLHVGCTTGVGQRANIPEPRKCGLDPIASLGFGCS